MRFLIFALLALASMSVSACRCDKDRRVPFYVPDAVIQDAGTTPPPAPPLTDAGLWTAVRAKVTKTKLGWQGSADALSVFADERHGVVFPISVVIASDGGVSQKIFEWNVPVECVTENVSLSVAPSRFAWLETRWRCMHMDAGASSTSEDHAWLLDPTTGVAFDEWSVLTARSPSDITTLFDVVPIDDPAYAGILRATVKTPEGGSSEARIVWIKLGASIRRDGRDAITKLHELAERAEKQLPQKPKVALRTATLALALYDALCRESRRAQITFETEAEPGIPCANAEDTGRILAIGAIASFQTGAAQRAQNWYRRFREPSVMIPETLRILANSYIADAGPPTPPSP